MTEKSKPRVVIDIDESGEFTVFADLGIEVICRFVAAQADELYRISPDSIPDGWLDRPIGYGGDRSGAEALTQSLVDILAGGSVPKTRLH